MNKKKTDNLMDLETEVGTNVPVRLRRAVRGRVRSQSSSRKSKGRTKATGRKRSTARIGGIHQRGNKRSNW